jgi:hypothetical protein
VLKASIHMFCILKKFSNKIEKFSF